MYALCSSKLLLLWQSSAAAKERPGCSKPGHYFLSILHHLPPLPGGEPQLFLESIYSTSSSFLCGILNGIQIRSPQNCPFVSAAGLLVYLISASILVICGICVVGLIVCCAALPVLWYVCYNVCLVGVIISFFRFFPRFLFPSFFFSVVARFSARRYFFIGTFCFPPLFLGAS